MEEVVLQYNSNSTGIRRRFADTSVTSTARSEKKRKFFCEVNNCFSSFLHRATYIRHMRSHEAVSSQCQICLKTFSNIGELQAHQAEAHEGHSQKSYPCSHCNKMFARVEYREMHLKKVMKSCSFVCVLCSKIFYDRWDMSIHMKSVHPDGRQFSCTECCMQFKRETHAIAHAKKHFPTDTHVCDICNREFNNIYLLLRHKNVHSSNKYNCTECGAGFTYKTPLSKHTNQQHPKSHEVDKTPKQVKSSKQVYAYQLKENV